MLTQGIHRMRHPDQQYHFVNFVMVTHILRVELACSRFLQFRSTSSVSTLITIELFRGRNAWKSLQLIWSYELCFQAKHTTLRSTSCGVVRSFPSRCVHGLCSKICKLNLLLHRSVNSSRILIRKSFASRQFWLQKLSWCLRTSVILWAYSERFCPIGKLCFHLSNKFWKGISDSRRANLM